MPNTAFRFKWWPIVTFFILIICSIKLLHYYHVFEALRDYVSVEPTHLLLFIFCSIMLLSLDFISPVPSFLIIALNANVLGLVSGIVISLTGLLLASIIAYFVASLGSTIIQKHIPVLRESKTFWKSSFLLIISKSIPGVSELISFYYGYQRYSFFNFVALSFLGYLPLALIFTLFDGHHSYLLLGFLSILACVFMSTIYLLIKRCHPDISEVLKVHKLK